jgi:hypothetical protein
MHKSTLDMFEAKAQMEDELKFALCEEFADEQMLPVEYVWQEFVNPEICTLEEVRDVLTSY